MEFINVTGKYGTPEVEGRDNLADSFMYSPPWVYCAHSLPVFDDYISASNMPRLSEIFL